MIECLDHFRKIVRVLVHVIPVGGLIGPAVPAPVNCDAAKAALSQKEHLTVPGIGIERPTVRERYG
ncbi:MAG TPA: hypothetical protein VFW94_09540 [Candidatus Acidoferrales bacterium]|nr:hypothetical protein [Candidatus Acidoferrales bacterium]